jgi:hypothetical protein
MIPITRSGRSRSVFEVCGRCERPRWVIVESAWPQLPFNRERDMPGARLPMRKIRDVLRLTAAGMSSRNIALSLSIGATTVIDFLQRARSAEMSWPLPEDMTDEALEARLFPASTALAEIKARRPQPDWQTIHRELRRKGLTLQLLWEEHRAAHPNGYGYSRYVAPEFMLREAGPGRRVAMIRFLDAT